MYEKRSTAFLLLGEIKNISANKCVIIHELSVVIRVCHIFTFI